MATKAEDLVASPESVNKASYGLTKAQIHALNPTSGPKQIAKSFHAISPDDDKGTGKAETPLSKEAKKASVPLKDVFKYADKVDWMLMGVGGICAVGSGAVMPFFALLFGNAIDAFIPVVENGVVVSWVDMDKITTSSLMFFGLGLIIWLTSYVQFALFTIASERQGRRIKKLCLQSILKQEIAFFDTQEPGTLATRIAGDAVVIQEGIGSKFGDLIKFFSGFVSGFIIGFVRGWLLALVMCASVPILAICMGLLMKVLQKSAKAGQTAYAKAGGVAEETFSSIRTVASFNGEKAAAEKYSNLLLEAEGILMKSALAHSIGVGVTMGMIFLTYALGMWFGGWLVYDGSGYVNSGGDVFSVFYAIMFGSMFLGQASPNMGALAEAAGAAAEVYALIERKSLIDPLNASGLKPDRCEGAIEFQNVDFRYPARPNVQILKDYSLKIEAGQTVALVGGSGGGKSTIISLLERFYDPEAGHVYLDGKNIKDLNIHWLRTQIGLVSQEPVLFAMSIKENIRFGKPNATDKEIEQACISANAHSFISGFPKGYDTHVGERGVQISGGQKQRIAIARAVLRDPTILLLDEATSALDNESERIVQEALDKLVAMKKRTTIIIAHRLTTIRNADQIAVVSGGSIKEKGTHDELMGIEDGIYRQLVKLQERVAKVEDDEEAAEKIIERFSERSAHEPEVASMVAEIVRKNSEKLASFKEGVKAADDPAKAFTEEQEKKSEEVSKPYEFSLSRIWALNRPERGYLVVSFIAAIANGFSFPASALILTEILNAFNIYAADHKKFRLLSRNGYDDLRFPSDGRERLTRRLRDISFRSTLRQDIGWFDKEENSVGVLTTRLATDATLVKAIAGENQGRLLQNMFTLLSALLIAFILGSWQLTLIMLGIMPLLILASALHMKIYHQSTNKSQEKNGDSGKLATQAISYIRTVSAFGMEAPLIELYDNALEIPMKEGIKKGHVGGVSVGFSQIVMFGGYALVFWVGALLIRDGTIKFDNMMKSLMAIMMAAQGLGQSAAFMGDSATAKSAAGKIFEVEDRKPPIDSFSSEGSKLDSIKGDIEIRNVTFAYPSRPNVTILKGYTLSIKAGQTVALVGSSGGGKSTIISLLERFYNPLEGDVLVDGVNVKDINVVSLRQHIGLVSQEPILFAGTIRENIAIGKPGCSKEEVERAAEMANARSFISSFPDSFETFVGEKGVQLSGGQKQRIAIARAIIKDPAVLLLDEATSALDSESERIVQQALDELLLMKKRTTIVIAHRLSTIVNSDLIAFVHQGAVAELGTHPELMARNGRYAKLYREKSEKN